MLSLAIVGLAFFLNGISGLLCVYVFSHFDFWSGQHVPFLVWIYTFMFSGKSNLLLRSVKYIFLFLTGMIASILKLINEYDRLCYIFCLIPPVATSLVCLNISLNIRIKLIEKYFNRSCIIHFLRIVVLMKMR